MFNSSTVPGVQPIPAPSQVTVINNTNSSTNTSTNTTNTSTNINTNISTNTTKNTTTNTSTNIPQTDEKIVTDAIPSDANVKVIDSYIRKEDAVRINSNSILKSVT